jgi:ankyrin repeat protein
MKKSNVRTRAALRKLQTEGHSQESIEKRSKNAPKALNEAEFSIFQDASKESTAEEENDTNEPATSSISITNQQQSPAEEEDEEEATHQGTHKKPKQAHCQVCNKLCTKRCAHCKLVFVCGIQCMKELWPGHKKLCNGIEDPLYIAAFYGNTKGLNSILKHAAAGKGKGGGDKRKKEEKKKNKEEKDEVVVDLDKMSAANGDNPLLVATCKGFTTIVTALLNAGANPNKESDEGDTPLCMAIFYNHLEVTKALLRGGAHVEQLSRGKTSPLQLAATHGDVSYVNALIKKGADVDGGSPQQQYQLQTPLIVAVVHGHLLVTRALIDAGCDVDKVDKLLMTPLYAATGEGHTAIVQLLLSANAKHDLPSDASQSMPLLLAAQHGFVNIMRALIQAGADVDTRNGDGVTPAYEATNNGHSAALGVLVLSGADMTIGQEQGLSPLFALPSEGGSSLVDELVSILCHAGASVHKGDASGFTPLHFVSRDVCARALMRAGADPNARCETTGHSPLHCAVARNIFEVVQALASNERCEVNVRDNDDYTALTFAMAKGNSAIVTLLRDRGGIE